jgi:PKD repeat protein
VCGPKTLIATLATAVTRMTVTADPAGSSGPPGAYPITSYTYNFGDGSPVVVRANSPPATHRYSVAGTYSITLTVSNTLGDAPGSSTSTPPPAVAFTPSSCPMTPLP